MFFLIYKITNNVNGKVYIGKHQTNDIADGYMGSGKLIRQAIEKYGSENFEKEILFEFSTEEEMNSKEAELVTEEFCNREDTYNLCPGGHGGFGYINSNPIDKFKGKLHTAETKKRLSEASKANKSHLNFKDIDLSKTVSLEQRKENGRRTGSIPKTESHKRKISESLKKKIVKCPHCDKIGGESVMKRWHFDKCKFK